MQWDTYSNRGHTQRILKVIQQHNPRQGFQIRYVTLFQIRQVTLFQIRQVTLFHHIFIIVTATNCCVHIKIHFTTIITSDIIHIYLPQYYAWTINLYQQCATLLCQIMCGAAQIVSSSVMNTIISSVPHCCGTYTCFSWKCNIFSVPVLLSGVPHYCDGTCMWSSWQCHLLSVSSALYYCDGVIFHYQYLFPTEIK
jgi:hypothetical protein